MKTLIGQGKTILVTPEDSGTLQAISFHNTTGKKAILVLRGAVVVGARVPLMTKDIPRKITVIPGQSHRVALDVRPEITGPASILVNFDLLGASKVIVRAEMESEEAPVPTAPVEEVVHLAVVDPPVDPVVSYRHVLERRMEKIRSRMRPEVLVFDPDSVLPATVAVETEVETVVETIVETQVEAVAEPEPEPVPDPPPAPEPIPEAHRARRAR